MTYEELYSKYVSHGMPEDMAKWCANESVLIFKLAYDEAKAGHVLKATEIMGKRWGDFGNEFLKPYGMFKDQLGDAIKGLIPAIVNAIVPGSGKYAAVAVGLSSRSQIQSGNYFNKWGSLTQLNQMQQSTAATSENSISNNQTSMQNLKRWAFVAFLFAFGLFGVLRYAMTKNTSLKRKRKPFLIMGIISAVAGGVATFFKLKKSK